MNIIKLSLVCLVLGAGVFNLRADELDETPGVSRPVRGLVVRVDEETKEEKVFLNKSLSGPQLKDENSREGLLDSLSDGDLVKNVTVVKSTDMRELDEVPASGAYYWYKPHHQYGSYNYNYNYNYNYGFYNNYNCNNFYYYSPYYNYSYSWGYYAYYQGYHWNFYW